MGLACVGLRSGVIVVVKYGNSIIFALLYVFKACKQITVSIKIMLWLDSYFIVGSRRIKFVASNNYFNQGYF